MSQSQSKFEVPKMKTAQVIAHSIRHPYRLPAQYNMTDKLSTFLM